MISKGQDPSHALSGFNYVYLLSNSDMYAYLYADTFVLVATDEPIELENFNKFASKHGKNQPHFYIPETEILETYLAEKKPAILTDDYVPTDVLLAPTFRLRQEQKRGIIP